VSKTHLNSHMTAAVLYGREDLRIEEVSIPLLGDDEVLIRVKVALTCGTDLKVWRHGYHARMITPPAIFGHELAGTVERLGPRVQEGLRPGMRVVPANSAPCNQCLFCRRGQWNLCEDLLFNNGAYAEYIRIPARIVRQNMLVIPDHVSFQDAALIEPLACVLRGVEETRVAEGDTVIVIGCGPIGLKFIRVLSQRGVRVIALGKRPSQTQAAKQLGAESALDISGILDPVDTVRGLTHGAYGADAAIEAVGSPLTWQWAFRMVRRGGTVNLFGGCPRGSCVQLDPSLLHYSEITVRSTFHHTPGFIREALDTIARGDIRASDFITGEISLDELPRFFEHMKHRNGDLKMAVVS
jgi:L-iditol 2-dehydrogenase